MPIISVLHIKGEGRYTQSVLVSPSTVYYEIVMKKTIF